MLLRLQLIRTGQFFVMSNDGVLTIELNSSIFNASGDFAGSFSLEGTMPLEGNEALLGNAIYISSSPDQLTEQVRMWLGNIPFKDTEMLFSVQRPLINYNLLIDKGIIALDMATRTLNQLFNGSGSDLIGAFDADTLGQFMLDTANAAPGEYPLVFFPVKNDGAYKVIDPGQYSSYPDISFPVSQYMNAWQIIDGVGSFVVDASIDPKKQSYFPFFSLVYVIKRVFAFYGLKATGSFLNDPDIKRLYIYTNVPIDVYIVADFQTYMPAIKVIDFLKAVRNRFGPQIDPDLTRKIAYIESLPYLLTSSDVIDFRDEQTIDRRPLSNTTTGYTITQSTEDKDDAFGDVDKASMPKMVIGDGLTEIPIDDVATMMINEDSPATVSGSQWRIPYLKRPVHAVAPFNQIQAQEYAERNNFSLRFLYYHGMVPDAAGYDYPYGSTDNVNQAGVQLTKFTLALNPSGTSVQSLKTRYTFLKNSKPFEIGFRISKERFLSLSLHKRMVIRDDNQATVNCIIGSYSADIEVAEQELIKAKLTLYPETWPNNKVQIEQTNPEVPPPAEDNGIVYVRLEKRNIDSTTFPYPPPGYTTWHCDLYVVFFADAAATIPKTVTGLPVRYNEQRYDSGSGTTNTLITTNCSGTETLLQSGAPTSSNSGGGFTSWTYILKSSAYYNILSS
ncbi:hypothetical protein ACRQ5D_10930 [Mucilaginibacter sp. P25]|uniref:hypothetical protein n=1 Tax=Mucilaginibacter sp. P25 TaxID=3423945 RepID=UPI003D79C83C